MKEKLLNKCVFCDSPVAESDAKELLEIHRWVKAPQRVSKREKTSISLPTCATCHHKFHPYMSKRILSPFFIVIAIIIVVCVVVSFIQRDLFSIYTFFSGFVAFVLCAGLALLFPLGGYFLAFTFFDDAFKASIKVDPYNKLEVVKFVRENGFVDSKDENFTIVKTEDEGYIQFLTFRDTLKERFGLR